MPEIEETKPTFADKGFGPFLALITVILVFVMFYFFVNVVRAPQKEAAGACALVTELVAAEARFRQLSTAKKAGADLTAFTAARSERDRLRSLAGGFKEAMEESKERRAMVKDIIMYILGVLSSALTTILGYYFGSSKGSSDKTTTLNSIASKSTQPSATPTPPKPPVQAAG
ncbi:MAG: hypothetical protein ACOYL3_10585 [Desulfuromonadaceae bacterium]